MKALLMAVLVLLGALAQVTVAPLFPIRAALPDLLLVMLAGVLVYAGPRAAMVAIPAAAILYGFASDRAPGLLLVAYVPLLPLAMLAGEAKTPVNRFTETLAAGVATGLWARLVLSFGAIAQEADLNAIVLVRDLLLPGMLLDLALLALAYLPFRLLGWEPRGLSLQRGPY